ALRGCLSLGVEGVELLMRGGDPRLQRVGAGRRRRDERGGRGESGNRNDGRGQSERDSVVEQAGVRHSPAYSFFRTPPTGLADGFGRGRVSPYGGVARFTGRGSDSPLGKWFPGSCMDSAAIPSPPLLAGRSRNGCDDRSGRRRAGQEPTRRGLRCRGNRVLLLGFGR